MDMTSCTESCGFECVIVYIKRQPKACILVGLLNICVVQGPILRPIQRFGRLSRRTDKKLAPQESGHDQPKDLSCLYLSIDEATNHVGGTRFR